MSICGSLEFNTKGSRILQEMQNLFPGTDRCLASQFFSFFTSFFKFILLLGFEPQNARQCNNGENHRDHLEAIHCQPCVISLRLTKNYPYMCLYQAYLNARQ